MPFLVLLIVIMDRLNIYIYICFISYSKAQHGKYTMYNDYININNKCNSIELRYRQFINHSYNIIIIKMINNQLSSSYINKYNQGINNSLLMNI